jgi:hypothetical protein
MKWTHVNSYQNTSEACMKTICKPYCSDFKLFTYQRKCVCSHIHSTVVNLLLSRQLSMMKFSRAISQVKWLSGEQTNVSKTISVLVLRVLVWQWLGKTFWPNIYIPGQDCLRDRLMGRFDDRFAWNPVTKSSFTYNLYPCKAAIKPTHRPVP